MRTILLAMCLSVPVGASTAAPEGIPHELARRRAAQISDPRYQLRFELASHAESVRGHEELQFHSASSAALLLDFREGEISKLTVNGLAVPPKDENGHLQLPASAIRAGENSRFLQKAMSHRSKI